MQAKYDDRLPLGQMASLVEFCRPVLLANVIRQHPGQREMVKWPGACGSLPASRVGGRSHHWKKNTTVKADFGRDDIGLFYSLTLLVNLECASDKPTGPLLAIQNKDPAYKHFLFAPINPDL
jgi:hypothetical protein